MFKKIGAGNPVVYDPTANGALNSAVAPYACPADPSMDSGIVKGGILGGASYTANAQVFAPLSDETIKGGAMYPANKPNFTDRGASFARIQDGTANTILLIHAYGLCGANQGSAWGYGAGAGKPPAPVHTFQPWSRASVSEADLHDRPECGHFPEPAESLCHEMRGY